MGHLHIDNALKIATGTYFEEGLQADFMAVATLNDAVVKAVGQHLEFVDGYPVNTLKSGLMKIVGRHQHSEKFTDLIAEGRTLVLRAIQSDEQMLGDLKYWHDMSMSQRIDSCKRFADLLKDIYVSHVRLPPDKGIEIEVSHMEQPVSFISYHGTLQPETFTALAYPHDCRAPKETIMVNTHPLSKIENGRMTYAAIYGQYIGLIERSLGTSIVREKYAENIEKLSHDIDLWKNATQQKAFVTPLLHDVHAMQFSTSFINAEEATLEVELDDLVEHHSENVPERIKLSARQKLEMFVGSVMGWNL